MVNAVSGFLSVLCLLAGLTSFANAQSGRFDGITVIELADEIGENAIRGKEGAPPSADSANTSSHSFPNAVHMQLWWADNAAVWPGLRRAAIQANRSVSVFRQAQQR